MQSVNRLSVLPIRLPSACVRAQRFQQARAAGSNGMLPPPFPSGACLRVLEVIPLQGGGFHVFCQWTRDTGDVEICVFEWFRSFRAPQR